MSKKLPEGFWPVKDFPLYVINREGVVRDAREGYIVRPVKKPVKHVRLRKDGKVINCGVDELLGESVPPF